MPAISSSRDPRFLRAASAGFTIDDIVVTRGGGFRFRRSRRACRSRLDELIADLEGTSPCLTIVPSLSAYHSPKRTAPRAGSHRVRVRCRYVEHSFERLFLRHPRSADFECVSRAGSPSSSGAMRGDSWYRCRQNRPMPGAASGQDTSCRCSDP